MAEETTKGAFTTVYESEDAGTMAFTRREEVAADVANYLEVVEQLKKDFAQEPAVVEGLREVQAKLGALRVATDPEEELRKKLQSLIEVPIGEDKTLRLDAFRKKAAETRLEDDEAYRARVARLVRNTEGNVAHLLLNWPEDNILQRFLKDIEELELKGDIRALKLRMEEFSKSPHLWHYNEKKKAFLVEWLKPYQEYFGKPIDELTEEELQASIQKVEELRDTKLEEMASLVLENDRAPFRVHNRTMHPIMNGKSTDFWGTSEVRDEFIKLLNKMITRFSLNLEDRFLLFTTSDGGFCYLVGFADEAFTDAVERKDGTLGIYPHLKVFLSDEKGHFREVAQEAYGRNSAAYYRALKTAVVPFLSSMGVMVEHVLSNDLRKAFDMWT
jgi:hypothetical protein